MTEIQLLLEISGKLSKLIEVFERVLEEEEVEDEPEGSDVLQFPLKEKE